MLRVVDLVEELHLIAVGLVSALESLKWVALMLGLVMLPTSSSPPQLPAPYSPSLFSTISFENGPGKEFVSVLFERDY